MFLCPQGGVIRGNTKRPKWYGKIIYRTRRSRHKHAQLLRDAIVRKQGNPDLALGIRKTITKCKRFGYVADCKDMEYLLRRKQYAPHDNSKDQRKMARNKSDLDYHIEGLILMIIFTMAWILSAGVFLNTSYFGIVVAVFGIAILYLMYSFVKFKKSKKNLSPSLYKRELKNGKWYYTVFTLEVIAIFAVIIILVKTGREHLIVSGIALIVGLHFLPMAKIFDRKFDYYVGFWIMGIAIIGLWLIITNRFDYKIINAFVCIGCAIATTAYGLKMAQDGNLFLGKYRK